MATRDPHAGRPASYDVVMAGRNEILALVERFQSAVTRRTAAETQIAHRFEGTIDPEEQRLQSLREDAERRKSARLEELELDHAADLSTVQSQAAARLDEAIAVQAREEAAALSEYEQTLDELQTEYGEKKWVVDSLLDEQGEDSPQRHLEQHDLAVARTASQQAEMLETLGAKLEETRGYWGGRDVPPEPLPPKLSADAIDAAFQDRVAASNEGLQTLSGLKLARWMRGALPALWWLLGSLLVAVPIGLLLDPAELGLRATHWWPIALGVGAGVSLAVVAVLVGTAYSARKAAWREAAGGASGAALAASAWQARSDVEHTRKREKLAVAAEAYAARRDDKQARMAARRVEREREAERHRDSRIRKSQDQLQAARTTIAADSRSQESSAEATFNQQFDTAAAESDAELAEIDRQLNVYVHHRGGEYDALKTRMARNWSDAVDDVRNVRAAAARGDQSAGWEVLASDAWTPPRGLPAAGLRVGEYEWTAAAIEGHTSEREGLPAVDDVTRIPAVMPLPGNPSLVLSGGGVAARREAERALMVLALRALTSLPPAQARLTVLDPVGLGEPYSSLMHLADFDERAVGARIWTEPQQIESQLADLTGHMENVLQTYLRGDFETVEEYNRAAGEVAEPYRFLIVSGFPHRFTELACRRLAGIMGSGPRCGVFVFLWHDASAPPPHAVSLSDLFSHAEFWRWSDTQEAFQPAVPEDPSGRPDAATPAEDVIRLPEELDDSPRAAAGSSKPPGVNPMQTLRLIVDPFPEAATVSAIMRNVGEASRDAGRVEVAFSRIAPAKGDRWTHDSRKGLDVPLGRAGATKLQHARFGKGTAQHMLVAGKTGSGKSTFLHALITNAGLLYGPDELRFFLIDFKKGVEFKAYAPSAGGGNSAGGGAVGLPHADVIGVESEREFGVSALKKLDALLDERGELFRAAGVADIAGYRDAQDAGDAPAGPMPRVLLVIDEFQEFFVEDDKTAQEASLHLDRLIRQGRAFGVHCVLGSQTLGGAYSLARSTLGQIGIRVALQCSEADAHLILSEDNGAARLLGRPGEAIYNDAGGLPEGNQHFQVAYLTDEQRVDYLTDLTIADMQSGQPRTPPVVFEGNRPARLEELPGLRESLHEDADRGETAAPSPASFAVGDSVEIRPHTRVSLPRQAGRNVLIVGSSADQTRGVLAAAAVQLASQSLTSGRRPSTEPSESNGVRDAQGYDAPDSPVLVLRDPDTDGGAWDTLLDPLSLPVRLIDPHEVGDVLGELTEDFQSRTGGRVRTVPLRFLIVDGLQQFRSLRKPEDDYGFGGSSKLGNPFAEPGEEPAPPPAEPGRLFADLCEGGPERGIFILASVDSAAAAERAIGRKGLREFGERVLFQMNANDSSQLIDSPAASRLDALAGLVFRDATGTVEKFRPFAVPDEAAVRRLLTPKADAPVEPPRPRVEEPAGLEDFVVL